MKLLGHRKIQNPIGVFLILGFASFFVGLAIHYSTLQLHQYPSLIGQTRLYYSENGTISREEQERHVLDRFKLNLGIFSAYEGVFFKNPVYLTEFSFDLASNTNGEILFVWGDRGESRNSVIFRIDKPQEGIKAFESRAGKGTILSDQMVIDIPKRAKIEMFFEVSMIRIKVNGQTKFLRIPTIHSGFFGFRGMSQPAVLSDIRWQGKDRFGNVKSQRLELFNFPRFIVIWGFLLALFYIFYAVARYNFGDRSFGLFVGVLTLIGGISAMGFLGDYFFFSHSSSAKFRLKSDKWARVYHLKRKQVLCSLPGVKSIFDYRCGDEESYAAFEDQSPQFLDFMAIEEDGLRKIYPEERFSEKIKEYSYWLTKTSDLKFTEKTRLKNILFVSSQSSDLTGDKAFSSLAPVKLYSYFNKVEDSVCKYLVYTYHFRDQHEGARTHLKDLIAQNKWRKVVYLLPAKLPNNKNYDQIRKEISVLGSAVDSLPLQVMLLPRFDNKIWDRGEVAVDLGRLPKGVEILDLSKKFSKKMAGEDVHGYINQETYNDHGLGVLARLISETITEPDKQQCKVTQKLKSEI